MGDNEPERPRWSVPPPPGVPAEAHAASLGEEFLYHLYRGSELLKEDQFYEAKSELERALAFQPRDVEGQSLLGVVYFRLGHYPRAIQIYEELTRVRPDEVAPRVNLSLCYLKTGQLQSARGLLEEIIRQHPEHVRAWGYLGLVYQRIGDFEKASIAFERAGRPQLAARLRAAQAEAAVPEPEADAASPSSVHEIAQHHVQAARTVPPPQDETADAHASAAMRPSSGAYPAPGTRVSVPVPFTRALRDATLVFPESPRLVLHEDGIVLARVERSFHARADCVRAIRPDAPRALTTKTPRRRSRGLPADEPLGGVSTPFVTLEGDGRLVLGVPHAFSAFLSELDGEPLYAREDRVLGFDGALEYECGRLALPDGDHSAMLQLVGSGFVVLATRGPVHGMGVSSDRPVEVRAARLIGWVGRLLSRPETPADERGPLRGLLMLSGSGTVLVDGG